MIIFILIGALIIAAETIVCFAMLASLCQTLGRARFPFYLLAALLAYPGFLGFTESTAFIGIPVPLLVAIPFEIILAIFVVSEYEFLTLWEPFIPSFTGNYQSDMTEIGITLIWFVTVVSITSLLELKRNKKRNEMDDSVEPPIR